MLLLAACVAEPVSDRPERPRRDRGDDAPEWIEGGEAPEDADDVVFADTGVLAVEFELDDAAIAQLAADPRSYVDGTFVFRGTRHPVGLRLKGSSTYQWIDGKPAWKVKFDHVEPEARFYGLERLTFDSNYWDASQMAETLAYRAWRQADAPAPRTGYAWVTLNGEALGLYTLVEPMDDGFVDRWWPGSDGGLYEMQRSCDVVRDCSCYELQETGGRFDPDGLTRACEAAASGDADAIAAHWDRIARYQALERALNHSDSYTFNLNNYYLYHDPLTDRVTITPWGADSTFSYAYPPDADIPCRPGYFDVLGGGAYGALSSWCAADAACWAEVKAELLAIADQLDREDLAGYAARTAERLDPWVAQEPRWPWGHDTFTEQAACFVEWIEARPGELRAYVAGG